MAGQPSNEPSAGRVPGFRWDRQTAGIGVRSAPGRRYNQHLRRRPHPAFAPAGSCMMRAVQRHRAHPAYAGHSPMLTARAGNARAKISHLLAANIIHYVREPVTCSCASRSRSRRERTNHPEPRPRLRRAADSHCPPVRTERSPTSKQRQCPGSLPHRPWPRGFR